MKINYSILSVLFLLMVMSVNAQPQRQLERIHAMKIALITEKLQLSPAEAEKFWPIYHQYEAEMKEIIKDRKIAKLKMEDADEKEASKMIDARLEAQEAAIQLSKKYKAAFLQVISPKQLVTLMETEQAFKQQLINELQNRRSNRGRFQR